MENEIDVSPEKNESKDTISNYIFLLSSEKGSLSLLNSYMTFINDYYQALNDFYKNLTEIEFHFLNEDSFETLLKETPFFQLGKEIKNTLKVQIKHLYSVINNVEIYNAFNTCLNKLSNVLKKISKTFNQRERYEKLKPLLPALEQLYSKIENKIIDEYIIKKYKKHLLEVDEEPLKATIAQAKYLEKTVLFVKDDYEKELVENSNLFDPEFDEVFNELKNNVKNLFLLLKANNISYLDVLEKEINLISKNYNEIKDNKENKEDKEDNEIKEIKENKENKEDKEDNEIKDNNETTEDKKDDVKKEDKDYKECKENNEKEEIKNIIQETKEETLKEKKEKISTINKYKIEILTNPTIKVKMVEDNTIEDNKNEININHKEKNLKEKEKNKNKDYDDILTLNEEDIYKIVSTIYSYDLKLIDTTLYNLDKENKKLSVKSLSEKLFSFDKENNIDEKIKEKELDELFGLLNNEDNLLKFFMTLNNFRATGQYSLTKNVFDIIVKIFNIALDYMLIKPIPKLDELIVILSQTFFIKKDETKYYIQKSIKNHALFKKQQFWEKQLNNSIEKEFERLENDEKVRNIFLTKELKKKKKREMLTAKIIPFTSYIKEFGADEQMILNIVNPIMDKYNLDERTRDICLLYLKDK